MCHSLHRMAALGAVALAVVACGTSKPDAMSEPTVADRVAPQDDTPQSDDIMAREPVTNTARVRHILIAWSDLAANYPGQMDPRGAARSRADADALVESLVERIRAGEPFEALMGEHSEDSASAKSGETIDVSPGATLVTDFKRLSLRLGVGEVGVVQTDFGWHIIKRER